MRWIECWRAVEQGASVWTAWGSGPTSRVTDGIAGCCRFAEIQSTPALLERFLKSGCEVRKPCVKAHRRLNGCLTLTSSASPAPCFLLLQNFPDLASPSGAAQQEGQEDQDAQ